MEEIPASESIDHKVLRKSKGKKEENKYVVKWLNHKTLTVEPASNLPRNELNRYLSGELSWGESIYYASEDKGPDEADVEETIDFKGTFKCEQSKEELNLKNKNEKVILNHLSANNITYPRYPSITLDNFDVARYPLFALYLVCTDCRNTRMYKAVRYNRLHTRVIPSRKSFAGAHGFSDFLYKVQCLAQVSLFRQRLSPV